MDCNGELAVGVRVQVRLRRYTQTLDHRHGRARAAADQRDWREPTTPMRGS